MPTHSMVLVVAIISGWLSFITILLYWYFYRTQEPALSNAVEREPLSNEVKKVADSLQPGEGGARGEAGKDAEGTGYLDHSNNSLGSEPPAEETPLGDVLAVEEDDGVKVLFVIFNEPSRKVDQRLAKTLSSELAEFNSEAGIFNVYGSTPQNPIRVANAFPPGTLPSLTFREEAAPLIKGVSLMLKKPDSNRNYNKLQVTKLTTLAKSLARIGGYVMDSKRMNLTKQEDFEKFMG